MVIKGSSIPNKLIQTGFWHIWTIGRLQVSLSCLRAPALWMDPQLLMQGVWMGRHIMDLYCNKLFIWGLSLR
ncbi:hypothetical protein DPEC_G00018640 [Dallia pectoralis]|uniref:Uncharacterized protein n=1 Tax=Dallia pectoralis TaxID=75939 RepID=A0ACC2HFI3_DALPE|nr:hypothetical protein DPEC_G00018640 [Dallia pectoralis]